MKDEVTIQREYYERTSVNFDKMHLHFVDAHELALSAFSGLVQLFPHESFLDVGAGTGRAVSFLTKQFPNSRVVGVEPAPAQRAQAYAKGVSPNMLIEGDALSLPFQDNEFDWVVETGVLHHVRNFRKAVTEMCRVARQGVMISDSNNLAQGTGLVKFVKRGIKEAGLWPLTVLIQTRGKGYKESEGDGVFYSFCAFDCVDIVKTKFPIIHYMNTDAAEPCLDHSAGHVMILARTT
jgi:ubiquinone/menaquinone biosynthesis C-methylase UbiE